MHRAAGKRRYFEEILLRHVILYSRKPHGHVYDTVTPRFLFTRLWISDRLKRLTFTLNKFKW